MYILNYEPAWEGAIDAVLPGKNPIRSQREYYVAAKPKGEWLAMLPDEVTLHCVDQALLDDPHLRNLDALKEEMCSERPSVEDFLSKSFGVCLVRYGEVVGWCLSEYNTATACEVGIETVAAYRRRGFGAAMACALVEQALARGLSRVGWDCWANNIASGATARKAGFDKLHDYPVYFAYFDEADNLAAKGNVCLEHRQYEQAMSWFERAFAQGERQPRALWGAAAACTAAGRNGEALRYLNLLADGGFSDLHRLQSSGRFVPLHGTPEWSTLIQRVAKAADKPA